MDQYNPPKAMPEAQPLVLTKSKRALAVTIRCFAQSHSQDNFSTPIIQTSDRLTRPQGELTLTMSANHTVRNDLVHFLDVLKKAV
jgi:hypothetical protein